MTIHTFTDTLGGWKSGAAFVSGAVTACVILLGALKAPLAEVRALTEANKALITANREAIVASLDEAKADRGRSDQRWQYTWCLLADESPTACILLLSIEDRMVVRGTGANR